MRPNTSTACVCEECPESEPTAAPRKASWYAPIPQTQTCSFKMRDVIAHWRRPGCRFYLGCYEPAWLERTDVPLMLSYHRLKKRRRLPRARGAWALDSGAYTHLAKYGVWRTSPPYYAGEVRRYRDEIGRLDYAAIQDWPCGDAALKASGLTVEDHIKRTVRSFLDLNMRAPDVNWMPIIQGRTPEDYLRCIDLYYKCGVELHRWPLVGMGSVADRQTDPDIQQFIYWFSEDWPLHIFGASKPGLSRYSFWIAGADSMAWSYRARFAQCLGGCRVNKCNNCLRFALNWRAELLESIGFELVHGETPLEASQGESTSVAALLNRQGRAGVSR